MVVDVFFAVIELVVSFVSLVHSFLDRGESVEVFRQVAKLSEESVFFVAAQESSKSCDLL